MSWQLLRGWLYLLCVSAVLLLVLHAGSGCDIAGPTKGPDYEKGYAYGMRAANFVAARDRKMFSGPAPAAPRGKSEEWNRGYQQGWKAGARAQSK
jgi:hypothetical protein